MASLRHRIAALVLIGTSITSFAACNAAAPPGASASGSNDGPSLILVTPEPAGANEFLKLAEKGIADAAAAQGGSSQVYESADTTKVNEQVDAAIAAAPDVIAVVGFEFIDAITAAAPANPEQKFLFIDACVEGEMPNVTCAVFREHEGVYLAGVEAALLSTTKNVGAVVSLDTPQIRRFADPFGAGAIATDSAVTFTPIFVGGNNPFNDPGRAKEQALSLISAGADVLMAASAAGNAGVFEAAQSSGALAIGVDVNQCAAAPGFVLDNVLKDVDVAVVKGTEQALAGNSGLTSYGLAEGGVTLTSLTDDVASSGCAIAQHPDVIETLKATRDAIISGAVAVADPATN